MGTTCILLLYPIIATVVCIKKPLKGDLLHWCVWWWTYEMLNLVNRLVWWVPLIDTVHSAFLFVLYFPICTEYFRKNVILYYLKKVVKNTNYANQSKHFKQFYVQSEKLIKRFLIYLIT